MSDTPPRPGPRSVTPADEEDAPRLTHQQIVTVLSGLVLGMFLAALDQTVVASALRTIADDLHGLTAQAWVTTAYLITGTVATPLYGKLSDIHGRRPVYVWAVALFAAGSLLCACATSMYGLAAARAVQGLGGGGLMSLAMTIVADITTPRQRGRYQGWFMAVFGTSSVVGPLVGGFFAQQDSLLGVTGWRWIFLVNVPLAAVAVLVILRVLHVPHRPVRHRLDIAGATALVVALVPLLTVAEQGRIWGWGSPAALGCCAVGACGLFAFLLAERRAGEAALLPLPLFRVRSFRLGTGLHFLVGVGMFGAMTTLPLYLQIVRGMSPVAAGLATLPMIAANLAVTYAVGRLIARSGRFKVYLVSGVGSFAAAMAAFATLGADSSLGHAAVGMVLMGAGMGASMQTLTILAQSQVPRSSMGAATASVNFFRSNGGTVGAALFLSVLFSLAGSRIAEHLSRARASEHWRALAAAPDNAGPLSAVGGGRGAVDVEDSAFLGALDPVVARPFLDGYVDAMRVVFLVGAAVLAVAFAVAAARVPDTELADGAAGSSHGGGEAEEPGERHGGEESGAAGAGDAAGPEDGRAGPGRKGTAGAQP